MNPAMLEAVRDLTATAMPCFQHARRLPLIGGVFGAGRFHLCSAVYPAGALDALAFFVTEERTGATLGMGSSKAEALAKARRMVELIGDELALYCEIVRAEADEREAEEERAERAARHETRAPKVASISRRRRRFFTEEGGQCAYCKCTLELDGLWHIDHRLPRALGGGNDRANLALACAPCNLAKADQTDAEFQARKP